MKADSIKPLVRPGITATLVLAQILLGFAWLHFSVAKEAFAALAPFTMMTLTFWFKDRGEESSKK